MAKKGEPRTNQKLATMYAQTPDSEGRKKPGPKKGCAKPPGSGRRVGSKSPAVIQREQQTENAIRDVFAKLSDAEIENITALRVMQLCMVAAVKAGQFGLALMSAEKLAPYTHAKLAPRVVDDTDKATVTILGGLPSTTEPEVLRH